VTNQHTTFMVVTILSLPFLLTDCTTKVVDDPIAATADRPGGQVLDRPHRVFVADFLIEPQAVQQDQGIGPSALRAMGQGPAAYGTAQQVQDAVASSLIENIRKMGLPVTRGTPEPQLASGDLLIQGQIVAINEGNRTRRLILGFGAGQSRVDADVQVYYGQDETPPEMIQSYDAEANSGHKPGLGVGAASAGETGSIGPGVVSGALGLHSEKQGVAGEGERLGNRVAYNLGEFFVRERWILPSAVPSRSLR
jgi:hypothetical protein